MAETGSEPKARAKKKRKIVKEPHPYEDHGKSAQLKMRIG
jgi:hypothetical protein